VITITIVSGIIGATDSKQYQKEEAREKLGCRVVLVLFPAQRNGPWIIWRVVHAGLRSTGNSQGLVFLFGFAWKQDPHGIDAEGCAKRNAGKQRDEAKNQGEGARPKLTLHQPKSGSQASRRLQQHKPANPGEYGMQEAWHVHPAHEDRIGNQNQDAPDGVEGGESEP
jgi:hypothetical protein